MSKPNGVCPFLGTKCRSCRGRNIRICEAVSPRKRVNSDNCVEFWDCMVYQRTMDEVNRYL